MLRRQEKDVAPGLEMWKICCPVEESMTSTLLKVRSWQWIFRVQGELRVKPGTRVGNFVEESAKGSILDQISGCFVVDTSVEQLSF